LSPRLASSPKRRILILLPDRPEGLEGVLLAPVFSWSTCPDDNDCAETVRAKGDIITPG